MFLVGSERFECCARSSAFALNLRITLQTLDFPVKCGLSLTDKKPLLICYRNNSLFKSVKFTQFLYQTFQIHNRFSIRHPKIDADLLTLCSVKYKTLYSLQGHFETTLGWLLLETWCRDDNLSSFYRNKWIQMVLIFCRRYVPGFFSRRDRPIVRMRGVSWIFVAFLRIFVFYGFYYFLPPITLLITRANKVTPVNYINALHQDYLYWSILGIITLYAIKKSMWYIVINDLHD